MCLYGLIILNSKAGSFFTICFFCCFCAKKFVRCLMLLVLFCFTLKINHYEKKIFNLSKKGVLVFAAIIVIINYFCESDDDA